MQQATQIDRQYHIDRCCVFGNQASRAIWCTFYALVLWIGIHVKSIPGLLHYVDDAFLFDLDEELKYYWPYDVWFPSKQALLLSLFDDIGVPHERHKQEFGRKLTIIGLSVDLDTMLITMPPEKRAELREEAWFFIKSKSHRHPL